MGTRRLLSLQLFPVISLSVVIPHSLLVHCQHFQPRPFLQRHAPKDTDLTHVRVIVWALPFAPEIRRSNRGRNLPSRLYSLARNNGGALIYRMSFRLSKILRTHGIAAVSPTITSEYDVFHASKFTYSSTWSERHAAYAAGLGTFGLSDGLITPLGKAIRVGSVIARVGIPPSERPYYDHHAYCLFFSKGLCGKCIQRCPAGAITMTGHNKAKCRNYLRSVTNDYVRAHYGFDGYGCGLCQTGVPCESQIPTEDDVKD